MDRISLCRVWYCLAHDFGLYGIMDRLNAMGFRPGGYLSYESLDDVEQWHYQEVKHKAEASGGWTRKIGVL